MPQKDFNSIQFPFIEKAKTKLSTQKKEELNPLAFLSKLTSITP